jgi:hypothetical protein
MVVIAADPAVNPDCYSLIAADPAVDLNSSVLRCKSCSRRGVAGTNTRLGLVVVVEMGVAVGIVADPAIDSTPVLPTPVVCSATRSLLVPLVMVVVEAGTSCSLALLPCR